MEDIKRIFLSLRQSCFFSGECWSGCGIEDTYNKDGNSSRCITYDFKACGPQNKYCVGKSGTNFVYTLNGKYNYT